MHAWEHSAAHPRVYTTHTHVHIHTHEQHTNSTMELKKYDLLNILDLLGEMSESKSLEQKNNK